ncbi:hypothetical protein KKF84_13100 [Myxococcota bacterium]|nr:hypothetical protein [Myxococcota bacterium]MBU1536255.1 hypothetical protein [Myxococcota bacterium]
MPVAVIVVAATLALGIYLGIRWMRYRARSALAFRRERGRKGEERARRELERLGYSIVSEQPRLEASMWIDGEEHTFTVRVDFLVEGRGERAIVEVKTGKAGDLPPSPAVRRQLFEYVTLYRADACYFMNGDTLQMSRIAFADGVSRHGSSGWPRWVAWLIRLVFALGIVYALLRLIP